MNRKRNVTWKKERQQLTWPHVLATKICRLNSSSPVQSSSSQFGHTHMSSSPAERVKPGRAGSRGSRGGDAWPARGWLGSSTSYSTSSRPRSKAAWRKSIWMGWAARCCIIRWWLPWIIICRRTRSPRRWSGDEVRCARRESGLVGYTPAGGRPGPGLLAMMFPRNCMGFARYGCCCCCCWWMSYAPSRVAVGSGNGSRLGGSLGCARGCEYRYWTSSLSAWPAMRLSKLTLGSGGGSDSKSIISLVYRGRREGACGGDTKSKIVGGADGRGKRCGV